LALKIVGRDLHAISSPSTKGTRETVRIRSSLLAYVSKLAHKVFAGSNVSWRRSFNGRIAKFIAGVVEFLQFVIGCGMDTMVKEPEKVGYRPSTLQR